MCFTAKLCASIFSPAKYSLYFACFSIQNPAGIFVTFSKSTAISGVSWFSSFKTAMSQKLIFIFNITITYSTILI
jgi:hypothetical protein